MIVYVVINEGDVVYVSDDEENARAYAENQWDASVNETAKDMGLDLNEESGVLKAAWQAGSDGGTFEVGKIDLDNYQEDDVITVSLENGDEADIDYNDICELLNKQKNY